MAEIDHITLGLSRLAFQFSESTRLKGMISAIMAQGNDLEAAHESTIAGRAIATALGAQLDVIGEIVGQPRTTLSADDGDFFGFWDGTTPNSYLGFSSDGVNNGGVFWDGNTALASRSLSDAEYSRFIAAKILRNKARGTHREIVTAIKFLLGDDTEVNVQDSTPGTISIGVSRVLNDAEQAILTDSGLVPISAGVGIEQWYAYVPNFAFGLMDSDTGLFPTGSKGLADEDEFSAVSVLEWAPDSFLEVFDYIIPTQANGYVYIPGSTGTGIDAFSSLEEPDWKTTGTVFDNKGRPDWLPNTVYATSFRLMPQDGDPDRHYTVIAGGGGSSGSTQPIWPSNSGDTVVDGALTWRAVDLLYYTPVLDPRGGGILSSSFT